MRRISTVKSGLRRFSWRTALAVLATVLALTSGSATALAHGHECGGVELNGVNGLEAARLLADEHNATLEGRYRLSRFRPRDAENGRAQVEKEVCSRLDLERDLLGLWRLAAVVAGGLFVLSLSWGGVVLMVENLGIAQPGRARSVMLSGFVGVVIVGVGFYLWYSAFVNSFGFFTLEIGEINPIGGVSPHAD